MTDEIEDRPEATVDAETNDVDTSVRVERLTPDVEAHAADAGVVANPKQTDDVVNSWAAVRLLNSFRTAWTGDRLAALFLASIAAGLILPFLGSFGFFDPWETHYGEVARQMAARDDHLYPFWKDAYFFSKPVLLFWISSVGYRLVGAGSATDRMPDIVEWVGRLPQATMSLVCIGILFVCTKRLWGRRAALLSGIVLATCPYWYFLSRQAITDMLYIAPMSAALLLLAVAFLDDDGAKEREQARIPWWLTAFYALCLLPQLLEIGRTGAFLNRITWLGTEFATRLGAMTLLVGAGAAALFFLHKKGRDPYIHTAAVLVALATLGKGPHALLFTGLVLFLYFLTTGEWFRLRRPALLTGIALYLAVALPWYVVMFFFTGLGEGRKTWFDRFVLYDLLGRVGAGVHGDRATFEYYIRYFAFGLFPWSIFAPIAVIQALVQRLPRLKLRTNEQRFQFFAVLWAVSLFVFFSAMTTKFHHYAAPVTVPVALLIGYWLDGALKSDRRVSTGLIITAALGTLLIARDLVSEPWQWVDLFTYHYKSYKPDYYFPSVLPYSVAIGVVTLVVVTFFLFGAMGDIVLERLRSVNESAGVSASTSSAVPAERSRGIQSLASPRVAFTAVTIAVIGWSGGMWGVFGPLMNRQGWSFTKAYGGKIAGAVIAVLVVSSVIALLVGWLLSRREGEPTIWASFEAMVSSLALTAGVFVSPGRRTANAGAVLGLVAGAMVMAVYGAQVYLPQLSQHWSQRYLIDTYYDVRNPGEPLLSFQMDWKGETFYAHNTEQQVKKKRNKLKKAVEKPGREFILVQQDRFKSIKPALGKEYENKIHVINRSNTKWFLVRVDE